MPNLYLSEANGEINFIVLEAARQRWTLPPFLCSVDGVLCVVRLTWFSWITVVAKLTLNNFKIADQIILVWVCARQLAEQLRLRHTFAARRRRFDLSSYGQIEVWGRQRLADHYIKETCT